MLRPEHVSYTVFIFLSEVSSLRHTPAAFSQVFELDQAYRPTS